MDDAINNLISPLLDNLQQKIGEVLAENIKPFLKKLFKGFKQNSDNIITETVELLNQKTLVEIANKHKVVGSTEVAVYKVDTDNEYIVYLAYTNNRELLDENVNKYVTIQSQAISRDIEKLFNNDQLIILK